MIIPDVCNYLLRVEAGLARSVKDSGIGARWFCLLAALLKSSSLKAV